MSLILVPGSSGSGKSYSLFKAMLKEADRHPERRFIVLVPEQNTLQTQKDLTALSERGGIWNIDVLSFTRLAYRVFEQTGVARRQILSETGKVLLLRLIAAREGKRLPLLKGILDRPGMLGEMKSILSEMDQYGIDARKMSEMRASLEEDGGHSGLVRKLSEISLLQEAFEQYQADHFITGEKLPRVLSEKAPEDASLKGAVFLLDGFTGFTPAQLEVIRTLLGIAADLTVSITIDPQELMFQGRIRPEAVMADHPADHELFALSKRTIQALVRCASEAGVEVQFRPVENRGISRHKKGGELEWLEQHLLRSGALGRKPYPGRVRTDKASGRQAGRLDCQTEGMDQRTAAGSKICNPDETDHKTVASRADEIAGTSTGMDGSGSEPEAEIFLRQCADPWDEAVSAAVTISELLKQGMRCREIAIVCGSLKDYAEYMRRVMTVYRIPHFIDRSSSVIMNPAFEFVRCAIGILEKNFSYESVMALLRTGLALNPESGVIDYLENYILAAGIRGHKAWAEPFTRQTREPNQKQMDAAQNARAYFMKRFEPFAAVMKKGKAAFRVYAKAVWNLLLDFDVPRKLADWSERYLEEGREDKAQEYGAVLRVISEVLDEAALLMGDEEVTRSQFAEILRAGFAEAKIGILPRGIDQVQIGDLERSRLENIRVIFFVGFNDGAVPRRKPQGGVLTDIEREYLRQRRIRLAPTAREDASIQQFYLYRTLTRPSQALYLSWSMAKRSGEELRPSFILRNIRAMFPNAAWANAASAVPFDSVTSLRTGISVLAQGLSDCMHMDRSAAQWLEPKLKELMNLYRRKSAEISSSVPGGDLSEKLAESPYSDSASDAQLSEGAADAQLSEGAAGEQLFGDSVHESQNKDSAGKESASEVEPGDVPSGGEWDAETVPSGGEWDAETADIVYLEKAKDCLRMLEEEELPKLDEQTAADLYGSILRGSITRLEEFAQCAFRHFADYGLGLREREEFSVRPFDIGNLLHGAIEIFSRRMKEESEDCTWRTITDDKRDLFAREALAQALIQQHGVDLYTDTRRSEGILRRCEYILLRSVRTIQRQIRAGAFEPAYFELAFGGDDQDSVLIEHLPDGRSMQLRGKIDRIDECDDKKAQKLYVKIVDYKSSDRDIDLESMIEGEQLQLMVYLDEAARLEKKNHPDREIVCAGVFYFAFQDPVIDISPDMNAQDREDAVIKQMRVKGLVNGSMDVVDRLDRTLDSAAGASLVVPVTKNKKSGGLRDSASIVTQEQIDLLRRYSRDKMRRISESILSGQIAPNPSRKDTASTACTWCPYKDVCRFDPHDKKMAYRERMKLTDAEKWELIRRNAKT